MAVIEVENLTRRYRSRTGTFRRRTAIVEALRGVSFAVERGELFGLLAPNGAGASDSLLKEATVGGAYLVGGLAMLRLFEFEGRRSASLETF